MIKYGSTYLDLSRIKSFFWREDLSFNIFLVINCKAQGEDFKVIYY